MSLVMAVVSTCVQSHDVFISVVFRVFTHLNHPLFSVTLWFLVALVEDLHCSFNSFVKMVRVGGRIMYLLFVSFD